MRLNVHFGPILEDIAYLSSITPRTIISFGFPPSTAARCQDVED